MQFRLVPLSPRLCKRHPYYNLDGVAHLYIPIEWRPQELLNTEAISVKSIRIGGTTKKRVYKVRRIKVMLITPLFPGAFSKDVKSSHMGKGDGHNQRAGGVC